MTGPSHVLSPEGEWLHFDAWDPAGVEAIKDLLSLSNACAESGRFPANEVVPAQCDLPGTRTRPNEEVMP